MASVASWVVVTQARPTNGSLIGIDRPGRAHRGEGRAAGSALNRAETMSKSSGLPRAQVRADVCVMGHSERLPFRPRCAILYQTDGRSSTRIGSRTRRGATQIAETDEAGRKVAGAEGAGGAARRAARLRPAAVPDPRLRADHRQRRDRRDRPLERRVLPPLPRQGGPAGGHRRPLRPREPRLHPRPAGRPAAWTRCSGSTGSCRSAASGSAGTSPSCARCSRPCSRPQNATLYHRIIEAVSGVLAPALAQIIARGEAEGVFDAGDPALIAEVLLGLANGRRALVIAALERAESDADAAMAMVAVPCPRRRSRSPHGCWARGRRRRPAGSGGRRAGDAARLECGRRSPSQAEARATGRRLSASAASARAARRRWRPRR